MNIDFPMRPANCLFPHSRDIETFSEIKRMKGMLNIRFVNNNSRSMIDNHIATLRTFRYSSMSLTTKFVLCVCRIS